MAADKTFTMDAIDPRPCLQQNGLFFVTQKSEESEILEQLMFPPFSPLCTVALLERHPSPSDRIQRTPGSDLTYWAILTLRQKFPQPIQS